MGNGVEPYITYPTQWPCGTWPVLGAGTVCSSSQTKPKIKQNKKARAGIGNGMGALGRALSISVIPSACLLVWPARRGSSPSHPWRPIVLGSAEVCPAEVPCPHANRNLCPGEYLVLIAFVFSDCPPSHLSLWQEVGSCSFAEMNPGLPPGLGWGQSHQNRMAAVLEC